MLKDRVVMLDYLRRLSNSISYNTIILVEILLIIILSLLYLIFA
jgi:hypothetical protein